MHALIRREVGDDKDRSDHIVYAHEIDPFFRVRIQGVLQKYDDTAISSTINLAEETTVETIDTIYQTAYREGLKGVTVYREGSREGVLETEGHAKKATDLEGKLTVERPQVVDERATSATYSIRTGEGKVHVTIVGDERGYPAGVFNNLGPIGTSQSSSISVMGLRLTRYLEEAAEPDLLKTLKDFGSVKSDKPIGYGPNRVDSLEHGFSIIWRYHLLRHGVIDQNGEMGLQQVKFKKRDKSSSLEGTVTKESSENHEENSGIACKECGSRNTLPLEGGCTEPVCLDCGHNKCS